jgi:hypothetical protein
MGFSWFHGCVDIDGYQTSDGSRVYNKSLDLTITISDIIKSLEGPLVFGNRAQMHALKAYAVIREYRDREHQHYENLRKSA